MNGDLVFSISDVWLMIEYVWLLPAKLAMRVVESYPELARFLEVDCSTGQSWGGGIFSAFAWLIVLGFIAQSVSEFLEWMQKNVPGGKQ